MSFPWDSTAWAPVRPVFVGIHGCGGQTGRDFGYTLHFEHGENVGGLHKEPLREERYRHRRPMEAGSPGLYDIAVPAEYFRDVLKRQAIVNPGVLFILRDQHGREFETEEFHYENGIADYVKELAGEESLTGVQVWTAERRGRDRADKPEYKVRLHVAWCCSNRVSLLEYYHNSSFLEHGVPRKKRSGRRSSPRSTLISSRRDGI